MKRVILTTSHDHAPETAAAVTPDNTTEMTTRVDDGTITTTITRDTTTGLRTTVDDYIVNLIVADTITRTTQPPNHEP